jgi:hypothetical protein
MREALKFVEWKKIPRLRRGCFITEKIDGTNAHIFITSDLALDEGDPKPLCVSGALAIYAGSRTRYIYPGADNYGFAAWVRENASLLSSLGEGRHYGEWFGAGIQRRYGLDHKRFYLFDRARYEETLSEPLLATLREIRVGFVPTLYAGPFTDSAVNCAVESLRSTGSVAVPGFMQPEGIVVFHTATKGRFKVTLENDEAPKGAQQ